MGIINNMINVETCASFAPGHLGPIIYDRVFWIYFIIALFFVIVGMSLIMSSNDPYLIYVSVIWLIANVALIILAYQTSIVWGPKNSNNGELVCFVDKDSRCFDSKNRVWLFVNLIFIVILILQVLWASELYNVGNYGRTLIGVFILI